jgi:ketosteroid isomerase-like protein
MNENKHMMQHIYSELSTGNSRPLVDSFADDVCWTIQGTNSWAKTYQGKQSVLTDLLGPLRERFAGRYTAVGKRFIAEDDLVVVEARGNVITRTGMPYNNSYCFIYRIEGGMIKEITEYLDTELVTAALG